MMNSAAVRNLKFRDNLAPKKWAWASSRNSWVWEVEPKDLATVHQLKSLKILALRKVPFRDEDFSVLQGHDSIESLFFEQALLTEKSLPVIESLKSLEYVVFSTKTQASRGLLARLVEMGIADGSFYPKKN